MHRYLVTLTGKEIPKEHKAAVEEKVEKLLKDRFPHVQVTVMDFDTATGGTSAILESAEPLEKSYDSILNLLNIGREFDHLSIKRV